MTLQSGLVPGIYESTVPPTAAVTLATGVPVFLGYGAPSESRAPRTPTIVWPVKSARRARPAAKSVEPPVRVRSTAPAATPWIDGRYTTPFPMTTFAQFDEGPGRYGGDRFLRAAVQGFFDCGGTQCQVVLLNYNVAFANVLPPMPLPAQWNAMITDIVRGLAGVDLVCAPSLMIDPHTGLPLAPNLPGVDVAILDIQAWLIDRCEVRTDLFAILDMMPLPPTANEITTWVNQQTDALVAKIDTLAAGAHDSRRAGAIYFPWLRPAGNDQPFVPPSGHVAGAYTLTDTTAGTQKPPANVGLTNVVDVQVALSDLDQSQLYSCVNCLRVFPGQGVTVWGARTLSNTASWIYVSVRRLFITLARWLGIATQWAVFEPNTSNLWLRLNRQLGSYLDALFYRGVLKGRSPAEAYYVKCDAENNPPSLRDSGTVYVELGLVPAIPGELIVVQLIQSAGGANVSLGS